MKTNESWTRKYWIVSWKVVFPFLSSRSISTFLKLIPKNIQKKIRATCVLGQFIHDSEEHDIILFSNEFAMQNDSMNLPKIRHTTRMFRK